MTQEVVAGVIPAWTVADRLRKSRENAGLSQQDLADRIGVSRNSVSNYEAERTAPRRIVLNAWSMATGVPVRWLETGEAPSGDPAGPDRGPGQPNVKSPRRPEADGGEECAIRDSNPEPAD